MVDPKEAMRNLEPFSEEGDLASFLAERRGDVEQVLETYLSATTTASQGAHVKMLVNKLANLDASREEVLRPTLREVDGGDEHLDRFDRQRAERLEDLVPLDDQSTGVGSLDVHMSQPERVVQLMAELRDRVLDYDRYEAGELVPFVARAVGAERMDELGRRAREVARKAPSHTHPGKVPYDETSFVSRARSHIHDRMMDITSHPEEAVDDRADTEGV
ncbi:MAG: hypothetical protein ACRD0H_08640 [Actinomycetes bacterium]